MLNELISIANELDKRGLTEEANELDRLATKVASLNKTAFACGGWCIAGVVAAVAALAGVSVVGLDKSSEGEETIWGELNPPVTDLSMEEAGQLYGRWRKLLLSEDIIDGYGTFPIGHSQGESWIREQFDARFKSLETIDEATFESTFEAAYGESALGLVQFGLDNEEGWVGTFNKIVAMYAAQTELTDMGLDWRTELAQGEGSENAWDNTPAQQAVIGDKPKEKPAAKPEPEKDREPSTLDEAAEEDESWESYVDSTQSIWKEVMGDGA